MSANLGSLIASFDEKWNAHDEEGVMGFFADDADAITVPAMPGEPGTYTGKEEVRRFVRFLLPGFYVESWNNRVVLNSAVSDFKIVSDGLRRRGVDGAHGVAEVVFKGDRIRLFHVTFAPETAAKFRAVAGEAEA